MYEQRQSQVEGKRLSFKKPFIHQASCRLWEILGE